MQPTQHPRDACSEPGAIIQYVLCNINGILDRFVFNIHRFIGRNDDRWLFRCHVFIPRRFFAGGRVRFEHEHIRDGELAVFPYVALSAQASVITVLDGHRDAFCIVQASIRVVFAIS